MVKTHERGATHRVEDIVWTMRQRIEVVIKKATVTTCNDED
jgi:hypothetical protein